tara:strand:+ start:14860 stop:15861 length:1002 start_codon:yes stop_codon:yes gene_type:complete
VPKSSKKNTTKDNNRPLPFWLPFQKNILWYLLALILVLAAVVANVYPQLEMKLLNEEQQPKLTKNVLVHEADLQTEIRSVADLENLLEQNVAAVERVLKMIEARESRNLEQLDGVAKTTLALDTRIQQLQSEVDSYKKQLAQQQKLAKPEYQQLTSQVLSLVDAYHSGDADLMKITNLHELAVSQNLSPEFNQSLKNLITATEGHGPVTNAHLMMLSYQLLHLGSPEVDDLLSQAQLENSYFDQARQYISKWVEVRKLEDKNSQNPWLKSLYDVQNQIIQGQYDKALTTLSQGVLKSDKRTEPLREKMLVAQQQQQALKSAVMHFKAITKGEQ